MAERGKARRALSLLTVTGLLTGMTWALPVRGEASQRRAGGLEITQVADAEAAVPGLTVTYTITARNTGTAALAGAAIKADLARLLDDAAYNQDATASAGRVSYSAPALTWTGDLPAGGTATIGYTVTISDPAEGDHRLASAVSSDTPGSTCTSGRPCVTQGTVPRLLDFGDAPQSYDGGADGPSHEYSTKLGLGSAKSSESGDFDDPEADADEGDDGVRVFPPMSPDMKEYALDVAVTNATGKDATLAGWIDLNHDGDFDGDERALAKVPAGATSATLNWTGLKGIKGEATFLRLRLFEGVTDGLRRAGKRNGRAITISATGYGGLGEVEDYKVVFTRNGTKAPAAKPALGVWFEKTANLTTARPGAKVKYTIRVYNSGDKTRTVGFDDFVGSVTDDAKWNFDEKAGPGAPMELDYSGDVLSWKGKLPPGGRALITYSVTVKQRKGRGDGRLFNEIVSRGEVLNCSYTTTDNDCSVTVMRARKSQPATKVTPVTPVGTTGKLANTGAPIEQMLRLAMLLLLAGSLTVAGASLRRRSRRRQA